jgi:hypothetical protein
MFGDIAYSLQTLTQTVAQHFGKKVLLLIDEYDAPILAAFERDFKEDLKGFFAIFLGETLKGNEFLDMALLTGIQRIAKESIFSKVNNLRVYTAIDEKYAQYFGFTPQETTQLLQDYAYDLTEEVKNLYDGYSFGGIEIYNPLSVLTYADCGELKPFWINTSTNKLIGDLINDASAAFKQDYEKLLEHGSAEVSLNLEASFAELSGDETLWGLLVNAGYLTVTKKEYSSGSLSAIVRIPNGEVRSEFVRMMSTTYNLGANVLNNLFKYLFTQNIDKFIEAYKEILMRFVSYFDLLENAYHTLFLGMCLSLNPLYKVTSNMEAGTGRFDIRLESRTRGRIHVVIEFKQGDGPDKTKEAALTQIMDNQYYTGLQGKVLCVGLAHNKKTCDAIFQVIEVP